MTAADRRTGPPNAPVRHPDRSRNHAIRRVGPILLSAVLACGWTTAAASSVPLRSVPEMLPAPELNLHDLAGGEFTFARAHDQVVLVNFWATWCPPCRKEMPALQRLSERLAGEPFIVLGVNVGEDPDRIADFLQSLPVYPGFPILLDRNGDASRVWQARVVPTTWIVDREARKVLGAVGEVDFDSPELIEQLRPLINAGERRTDKVPSDFD